MINEPIIVSVDGFQQAWIEVVKLLTLNKWEIRNLIVQIKKTNLLDRNIQDMISAFANSEGLLAPKHVAYTIFPHGLYYNGGNAFQLFEQYNRPNGLYDRLQKKKRSWGTYFRRMTHYERAGGFVNQLGNIITAIQGRRRVSKAAFTIVIQKPGGETVRPLGGPCLNYISVQVDKEHSPTLGLLAVYRNHDFLKRAYGNYWGLCNLLNFIANEVGVTPGPLTCISSHAYVEEKKKALQSLLRGY